MELLARIIGGIIGHIILGSIGGTLRFVFSKISDPSSRFSDYWSPDPGAYGKNESEFANIAVGALAIVSMCAVYAFFGYF